LKKVHSLIDKVYHPTNLNMAWEKVRSNKGAGGIDRLTLAKILDIKVILHGVDGKVEISPTSLGTGTD